MPHYHASAVLSAPIDTVWSLVRDFGGIKEWVPGIVHCQIEDGLQGSVVGCVRRFECSPPPITVRERLLALDDLHHSFIYTIVEFPLPVTNYVSRFQLHRVTLGDHTFAQWNADYRCPPAAEAELDALFSALTSNTLSALQRRFAGAT